MQLPQEARDRVDRIRALLGEAERLQLDRRSGEDAYALRMTRERYLDETLDAYARIPLAARGTPDASGKTPDEQLNEQLTILERATAARVVRTADDARAALSANGRFLTERLGAAESLPEAPAVIATDGLDAARFTGALQAGVKRSRDLVNAVGTKLERAFPLLVEVDRGLFGSGPARKIAITVPAGNDRLRYTLVTGRGGEIETACAKIVRGVTIRTESVPFEAWARALYEDLRAYAATNMQTLESLQDLLR